MLALSKKENVVRKSLKKFYSLFVYGLFVVCLSACYWLCWVANKYRYW